MDIRDNAKGFAIPLYDRRVGSRFEAGSLGTSMTREIADNNGRMFDGLDRSKARLASDMAQTRLDVSCLGNDPN